MVIPTCVTGFKKGLSEHNQEVSASDVIVADQMLLVHPLSIETLTREALYNLSQSKAACGVRHVYVPAIPQISHAFTQIPPYVMQLNIRLGA